MQQARHHFSTVTDAFIYGDWLLHANQEIQQEFLLYWTTETSVILGMKDSFAPHFKEAIPTLPYPAVIRSSGGRAIINNNGIINLSLYYTGNDTIDAAYQKMVTIIENLCHCQFEVGEVTGSYCPGRFDLAIDGKKIAGLSQRRYKDSIVVMCYLSLGGDQIERGTWLQHFYHVAGDPSIEIQPTTMAVLETTTPEMLQYTLFKNYEPLEIAPWLQYHWQHPQLIEKMMKQWQQRQKLLEE